MAFVGTFFTAVGRLAVRFRWAIVLAWIIGMVAAMALLPSLGSVTQGDNTSFLPASAPSQQAAQLASPLQGAALTAVTVVVARPGGTLTGADQADIAGWPSPSGTSARSCRRGTPGNPPTARPSSSRSSPRWPSPAGSPPRSRLTWSPGCVP